MTPSPTPGTHGIARPSRDLYRTRVHIEAQTACTQGHIPAFMGLGHFGLHAPFMAEAPSKIILKDHCIGIKMNIIGLDSLLYIHFFGLFFHLDFKRKSDISVGP